MNINILVLLTSSLFLSLWNFISADIVSDKSGSLKLFLRTGSHKHRKDDVFVIPGKGCKTPLLMLEGGHKAHHRGMTNIIMQGDCEKKEEIVQVQKAEVVPFPIPIPVFKHYYHQAPEHQHHHHDYHQDHYQGHQYTHPMHWTPYTNVEQNMQIHIQPPPHYYFGQPMIENRQSLDHQYFTTPVQHPYHGDFVDNILSHVGNALAYHH